MSINKYHLFWHGVFSQWHPSEFEYGGIVFNCCEQFMMFYKAIFFNDHETAAKILNSSNPKEQKKLGRQVKNFDVGEWASVARHIVYTGNECKFTQNPDLCKQLVETYPATLVEASPYDKVWGIGLEAEHPDATDPTKWKGKNWLGEVLTSLRNNIMNGRSYNKIADNTMGIIAVAHQDAINRKP
jgi:ribA/ribD-fused uncharacterized protein